MSERKKGHVHHGKSTRGVLNPDKVLAIAGLKSGDIFLDAGCGDGYISFAASTIVGDKGKVYAIDVYTESKENEKQEAQEKGMENLEAKILDLTDKIPLNDDSIDLCIMANVLHGFVENDETEDVMKEISRVIKPEGIFAVVEFKKMEGIPGPPMDVRLAAQDVEDILAHYGFEAMLTSEVGLLHYLVKTLSKK